jgi:hypothetical protein
MNKIICEKCGCEINAESAAAFSVCGSCDANVQLPIEKTNAFGGVAPNPKTKNMWRVIFITFLLTAWLLIGLFAGGTYWFVNKSLVVKPTPRSNNSTLISPEEILQIEYTDSTHKAQYAGQYFSNYALKNYFHRESHVTLIKDGRAKKTFVQREIFNGAGTPERSERYAGIFPPEKFAELARALVENDFIGEQESGTSTMSPVNQKLTVVYLSSRRVKAFQAGDSASDTPEAEAMLKSFKELENKVDWQREK